MPDNSSQQKEKAMAFFAKAESLAGTGNYDYAIEMYLEGLKSAPDALKKGHLALHQLALRRQVKGGKKPSMMERMKRMRGKTPVEQLINAQHLFSKDPDNISYAEAVLKACIAGEYDKTAQWMADLVFGANKASRNPSFRTYILLKNSYSQIGAYEKALVACQMASVLKPEDGELADEFKRLSAELTVAKGKYDQAGDFRKSIKNRKAQEKLQAQDGVVKSDSYRIAAVKNAREDIAKEPQLPKNIFNLASALMDTQEDEYEKEAILLLEKAYKDTNNFSFQQRAGEFKMRFLRRKIRKAKSAFESDSNNARLKSAFVQLKELLKKAEIMHYKLCVDNYPTDLAAKYEYGVRLVNNKKYDEAIPFLQDSQKDPRHKIVAMDKIGVCFFAKGWFSDAIDIFNRAIEQYEIKDDAIAKDLRYNLGRSYQKQGENEKALEIFRKIAQMDFGYKDVHQRVDELRDK
ncbi:MAG: tetratricopeptide repeat protein [Planctomycetes bacterium]|nr:tetratricopeptide repeat protein [Planctomycetota bacterium]